MANYYWSEDTFGSNCPQNWEEIADAVNDYLHDCSLLDVNSEEDLEAHSEMLWNRFCEMDEICGITAEW